MSERDETLQIFFSETKDLLRSAEDSLLALESSPESASNIERLFRSVHTIKSGAAMVGFPNISEYSHLLETLMDRLRSGELTVSNNLITFLLKSVDFVRSMVENVNQGNPETELGIFDKRKDQVKRYLGIDGLTQAEDFPQPLVHKIPRETTQEFSFYKIDLRFKKNIFYSGQNPLLILLDLSELGELIEVIPDLSQLPDLENFRMYDLYISWQVIIKTECSYEDIEDVFIFVKDNNDIYVEDITNRYRDGVDIAFADKKLGEELLEKGSITEEVLNDAVKKQKMLGEILLENGKLQSEDLKKTVALQEERRNVYRKTTIRVDVKKINSLVTLAEVMGVAFSRLQSFIEKYAGPKQMELTEGIEELLKLNLEFQEEVARVRLFSLEGTFRRFQRMVRDLAFQQNKQIKVIVNGIDTELDKEVIEHITDPLKHLVRNCVDHGIETPEERKAMGKPPTGNIEFKAYQKGGKIFVEISDDGRGIDLDRIQKKALNEGWIKGNEALSKESLLDFIFQPGFSTTSKVTDLSGRGVGMDVVKTELQQLGGTIGVNTQQGKGTVFTLCLPMTFALMETLSIVAQNNRYLIPLKAVIGTEIFDKKLVKGIGSQDTMYPFRGDYIPIMDIGKLFDTGIPSRNDQSTAVVFVKTEKRCFGIAVDEVLKPQQIIVKTLETNYRRVNGIYGASLLGDGSVSLVLDVSGLEKMFSRNSFDGGTAYESENKPISN